MLYRVAAVSFLNTIPLIDWFEENACDRVSLTRALPSQLSPMLADGEADVALLPVAEIFRGPNAGMLAATGISSLGAVDSVKLFSNLGRNDQKGLQELHRIRVDRGSRTSVALLEVLLRERTGACPELVEFEPRSGAHPEAGEAVLVIGDRCLAFERELAASGAEHIEAFDLGEMWHALTGLPFVFAAWTAAEDLPDRVGPDGLAELNGLLIQARDSGLARLVELAEREARHGGLGLGGISTPEAILAYFKESLRYPLLSEDMAGLLRFHELCIKHGVVPSGPSPKEL